MTRILATVPMPYPAFRDRAEAGRRLAEALELAPDPRAVVLAVPRGGVPVAAPVARALGVPLELLFVRKLPIPTSPEAGFGAVTLDGSAVLNEPLVRSCGLSSSEVERIVAEVRDEVRRRAQEYAGHERPPAVEGKRVYMVDDGLASGYTMLAAARMVRRRKPRSMTLCVPVSPDHSLERAEPYFDEIVCLIAQKHVPFAVASFYRSFPDLTDAEVRDVLEGRQGQAPGLSGRSSQSGGRRMDV